LRKDDISPDGRDDKMEVMVEQNNSILIKKPAVVFIGEARENQLPISFRANSCN